MKRQAYANIFPLTYHSVLLLYVRMQNSSSEVTLWNFEVMRQRYVDNDMEETSCSWIPPGL